MEEPILGAIVLFGFGFTPKGWAACNGQLLDIPSNNALFSLLGTTYGGDGKSNFALPDLQGRVAISYGVGGGNFFTDADADVDMGSSAIGNTGGNEPVPTRPPYLVLNYCIAVEGVFPSQR